MKLTPEQGERGVKYRLDRLMLVVGWMCVACMAVSLVGLLIQLWLVIFRWLWAVE